MPRALLAIVALILVGAHATGSLKGLLGYDFGLEPQHLLYFAALPFTCVLTYVMLARD